MAWYAYILKCIYHSAIGLVRKHYSRNNYLESSENEHVTPGLEVAMLEQETLDRLHVAIESLPVKYRTLLRMSYQEGLKNAEIASRLGVAEITVKKQRAQMLMMLREKMREIPLRNPFYIKWLCRGFGLMYYKGDERATFIRA